EVAAPEVAAPEVPATVISAPEVPASEVAASEVPAAVVPATGITVGVDDWGRQKLSEQEPGEQAGTEAVTAPVGGGEAGDDVAGGGALTLPLAPLGLDAPFQLVRVGGADRALAARPAVRGRPVGVGHRHAVPRIEKARWPPLGPGLAGRDGLGAGQVVLALGDGPADRAHGLDPAGRVQGRGPALAGAQRRGLLLCRLRVAADGDVGVLIGEPGAERDQVVLGGQLGLLELLLPAPADGAADEEDPEPRHHGDDPDDDQDVAERV